jgi:hypothetical protein
MCEHTFPPGYFYPNIGSRIFTQRSRTIQALHLELIHTIQALHLENQRLRSDNAHVRQEVCFFWKRAH